MTDPKFLQWIHDRLIHVHGEDPFYDYMIRLRDIAQETEKSGKVWYLLYNGTSVDGRGNGTFYTRTTDKEVAKKHWDACNKDPYSIGKVVAITDTEEKRICYDYNWEAYD